MSTTTVRLDDDDEELLDLIAAEHGGRSGAIRVAIRSLAADRRRRELLATFLDEWDAEAGPVDDADVEAMIARFGL